MQFEDVANEVGCEYLHYYFYVTCHVLRCHWRSTLANLYSTLNPCPVCVCDIHDGLHSFIFIMCAFFLCRGPVWYNITETSTKNNAADPQFLKQVSNRLMWILRTHKWSFVSQLQRLFRHDLFFCYPWPELCKRKYPVLADGLCAMRRRSRASFVSGSR